MWLFRTAAITFILISGLCTTTFGQYQAPVFFASNNSGLITSRETEIIQLINQVRTDPARFADQFISPLIIDEEDQDLINLHHYLSEISPLPALEPLQGLQKSAIIYARALSRPESNIAQGHLEQPFYDRIHQYLPGVSIVAESNTYGSSDPLIVVLQLLLENKLGSSALKNIFDPSLKWIGLSTQPDKNNCYFTVIDFAGKNGYGSGEAVNNNSRNRYNPQNDKCPPGMMVKKRTRFYKLMQRIF